MQPHDHTLPAPLSSGEDQPNFDGMVPPESWNADGVPLLQIGVLHHDDLTRSCAHRLCQKLMQRFGTEVVQCSWWLLSDLHRHPTFEQALETVCKAQILMVALRAPEPLPQFIKDWLHQWTVRREEDDAALVALFACDESEAAVDCASDTALKGVATAGGVQYFSHRVLWRVEVASNAFGELRKRQNTMTQTMSAILDHTHPANLRFWGIND